VLASSNFEPAGSVKSPSCSNFGSFVALVTVAVAALEAGAFVAAWR
jgi:hypothetical protein